MISKELLLQIAKEHSVTDGELEVLEAIVISGETITDVSNRLKLQPEAVRKRLGEVYRKFGIIGKGPGKLAKLQQLLLNNPSPRNRKLSLAKSAPLAASTKVSAKGSSYREQRADSDYLGLGSRSIADLSRGESVPTVLISDLAKPTGSISDWGAVPDVEPFYAREKELEKLRQWIVDDRSRLVVLHGMGGIGKTSLAVKAAQPLEKEFDGVIWRSLKHAPSLYDLIAELEDIIDPEYSSRTKSSIDKLLHDLNKRRYLIILDDLESIFETGEKAGQYRQEYAEYGEFIKRIALENNHKSCLVLVSREKMADLVSLESNKVHSLQIDGSSDVAQQILTSQSLESNDSWTQVIDNYGGNPLCLKILIPMIKDLYGNQVEDFLSGSNTTTLFEFHVLMDQQFDRLSLKERDLMYTLAVLHRPIGIAELSQDGWVELDQSELLEYMSSLLRRSLLERTRSEFSLHPMIWRHTIEQLINEVKNEIINFLKDPQIDFLETLKAYPWEEAEDVDQLLFLIGKAFKSKSYSQQLDRIIAILEEHHEDSSGFAIDNLKLLKDYLVSH